MVTSSAVRTMIAFDQLLDGVRVDSEPLVCHDPEAPTVQCGPGRILVVQLACGATVRVSSDSATIVPPPRLVTAALGIRATCQGSVNLFDRLSDPLVLSLASDEPLRR
jgi:hypothetical protein